MNMDLGNWFYRGNILPLHIQDIKEDKDYMIIISKYLLLSFFSLFLIFQVLAIIVFNKSYIYIFFIILCYFSLYYLCIRLCKVKYI
jgi:hypothetical protein